VEVDPPEKRGRPPVMVRRATYSHHLHRSKGRGHVSTGTLVLSRDIPPGEGTRWVLELAACEGMARLWREVGRARSTAEAGESWWREGA